MTRREAVLTLIPAMFPQWIGATESHVHTHAPPEPDRWTNYKTQFFSAREFAMLDAFTSILIPTDDTPGAQEAHIPYFLDFVLHAAIDYEPSLQADWRNAMKWLDSKNFGDLSPAQELELITAMSEPETDHTKTHDGYETYRLIKEMTVQAFYTSRAGLVDALEYKGIAYLTEFPACTHPEHHRV